VIGALLVMAELLGLLGLVAVGWLINRLLAPTAGLLTTVSSVVVLMMYLF
jgi:hypothetical protein